MRWNEKANDFEDGFYILLYQNQLSVFKGDSQVCEALNQYQFPHGAEYIFEQRLYKKKLRITDKNGFEIILRIQGGQLFNDIYLEWLNTKIFTNFQNEPAEYITRDDFDEINYSFKYNLPSFREFENVYNQQCMSLFQYYPIVDGKPQIKNAVEFKHFYRPNRMMTSQDQEYDEKIEEPQTNKNKKFMKWGPSRDWSRLFVLSTTPSKVNESRDDFYLEFYDFNSEKQANLSSPLRINYLSQLLRPQWITFLENIPKETESANINVSFNADTMVYRIYVRAFTIVYLNPDWTYKGKQSFYIDDAGQIDSLKLSSSKLWVKSNEFYFEQNVSYLSNLDTYKITGQGQGLLTNLKRDFRKTNLKNIIRCGVHDILVYENHVKIFNNINPLDILNEIAVDNDILNLLKSQFFIQLDHFSIACFKQDKQNQAVLIMIIEISQDNLVMKQGQQIFIKSPWGGNQGQGYLALIKLKKEQFAVFILISPSKKEFMYQFYRHQWTTQFRKGYELEYQKPISYYSFQKQIPHLPLLIINKSSFINCDSQTNNYHFEQDLKLDEREILSLDKENVNSQDVVVFNQNFMEQLFRSIEEKQENFELKKQFDRDIRSIEIPELQTSIMIKSGKENSGVLIFQQSIEKIKHIKMKKMIRYKTHRVIFRDASYYVRIILSTDDALFEMQMCFNITGVTLNSFKFIMNLTESQNVHEIYLNDDFTVSMFIAGSDCFFKHFSLNSLGQQEETIKFDIIDAESQLSSFIRRIAHNQSISIGKIFLKNFKSKIFKNAEGLIKKEENVCVFAFQNKIILFEKGVKCMTIMEDSFNVISTVILSSEYPPSVIRIASQMNSAALEFIDELGSKQRIPIFWNWYDYQDGFISHLDLKSEKLSFFKSNQDQKNEKISARIEIMARRESFIDFIINSKQRKEIEERLNQIEINDLLTYNMNKRMNLITGTRNHSEKDLIYSVLYKRLEIADIMELPILIYNTSADPNKYESILDVLIENKAIKLAQLFVSIAIKQDQIGQIYTRLGPYLQIISANELQNFFESQIFFSKIPIDCYEEYQILKMTIIRPYSGSKTFSEIKKNMKNVENQIYQIMEDKGTLQKKFSDQSEEGKEGDEKLQISKIGARPKDNLVPIEYFAINLMHFITSKQQPINEDHREVTQMLNQLVKIDGHIFEKESIKIIIDFKWNSYARIFFIVQLFFFTSFIIAFIIDVVAVSKSSHIFSSDDQNQAIPRMISIAIMIAFTIYEIANIVTSRKTYFKSFWNLNDLLLIFVYATYFTMTFESSEQQDVLKSLQLLIVIFSFIKLSFLIRIWTQVSFLVRMLIVVFKELLIFLFFFILVIGGLTVMAQIIIKESGDEYEGIKLVAFFVIVMRQAVGDYDTLKMIEGSKDFKILAWFFWFLILIIGNIVFMNFIIAVVSESYESCMEKKIQLIYRAKLEMISECEDLMPEWVFSNKNWFPRFIVIRREQGSTVGGDNPDEWYGFVKHIQKHLEHETSKLNATFIQNINRSTESTKKEIKTVTRDVAEMKLDTAEMKDQIKEIKSLLSRVLSLELHESLRRKSHMKVQVVQANDNQAI